MDNWFIAYQVWKINENSTSHITDCVTEEEENGIVCAESFSDAVKQIEEYYDDTLISIKNLEYITDSLLIMPNKETLEKIKERNKY